MIPNSHDLTVWLAHRLPNWAQSIKSSQRPSSLPSLHYAINARAKIKLSCEPSNACEILKMVRRRNEEPLIQYMRDAALTYAKSQPARACTYRRWLRRHDKRNYVERY